VWSWLTTDTISSSAPSLARKTRSRRRGAGLRGAATQFVAIRAVGGAVNDVDPDATAYPHRHQNFNVSSVGADAGRFRAIWDELRPHLDGLYLSFETDQRPQRLRDAFGGPTLTRLRELKAVYDPQNVFNQNFPLDPVL
jgi:FAD/FMN-containing dehydrogenase